MKWQYETLICANNYELKRDLNKFGKKGWEAYNVVRADYPHAEVYIGYLKRPKREPHKRMPRHSR